MDFAPYQSSPPEHNRPFSPPTVSNPASPRASLDRRPYSPSQYQNQQPWRAGGGGGGGGGFVSPPPLQHPQPQRSWQPTLPGAYPAPAVESGGYRDGVSEFDTSLGIRLDYEACLAYLAVPPLGAIILLILERNSDYVRFHAWQSSLLFTAIFIVHLIVSASPFLSWALFIVDLCLMAWLAMKAYRDADTLDRFEVPLFGHIASRFLDDE